METSTLTFNKDKILFYTSFLQKTIPLATTKLRADKQPLWGKMTAQHMIEHLQVAVVASTIIKTTPAIPATERQLETKKFLLYSDSDMPRNLDNPAFRFGLPEYSNSSLAEAKDKLVASLARFLEIYEQKPNAYNFNPFLGDINVEENIAMHYKHFKHHYSQFDLL